MIFCVVIDMDTSNLSPDTLAALRALSALPDKAFAQVSRCAFGALTAGSAFSADKVAKMLKEVDSNGDGVIDFEEFKAMMLKS